MKSILKGLTLFCFVTLLVGMTTANAKSNNMKTSKIDSKTFYVIENETQLRAIGSNKYKMSDNYMLNANITLKNEWVPIGDEDNPFTGTFNGNGFIISNLKITYCPSRYVGFFGYAEGATVYNITLKNVDIASAGGLGKSVGAIVAMCFDGKVYNNTVLK